MESMFSTIKTLTKYSIFLVTSFCHEIPKFHFPRWPDFDLKLKFKSKVDIIGTVAYPIVYKVK